MSKAVMISIKPRWCEFIALGMKTIEVRKTKPKLKTPFKVYIYCTKNTFDIRYSDSAKVWQKNACCKVIGEFLCDKITVAELGNYCILPKAKTLIDEFDLLDYADEKTIYGWGISNLVIYDKPRELREFYKKCDEGCEDCDFWKSVRVNADEYDMECSSNIYGHKPLTRPPQSWCYVEGVDNE